MLQEAMDILPDEIIICNIFPNLGVSDKEILSCVCRRFSGLVLSKKFKEEQLEHRLGFLPNDEMKFLIKNVDLTKYIYMNLHKIKTKSGSIILKCRNSYERRFVHIVSHALGLYHARHGEWTKSSLSFDGQCSCRTCWSDYGKVSFRIVGVRVSSEPLQLSRKDIYHQKETKKTFNDIRK